MSNEFIGLMLGTVSDSKLTLEQLEKANRVLKYNQQKHFAKIRKQRAKRK